MDPNLIEQLRGKIRTIDTLEGAVSQLENQMEGFSRQVGQMRVEGFSARNRDPSYRGVFESRDQARGFGLLMLAQCAKDSRAADLLKKDYPGIYEHAMASNPGSSGGALVPSEFVARLLLLVERYGVFERNAMPMPMNEDQMVFYKQDGEMDVFLLSENINASETEPTFSPIELHAKEWGALTLFPRSLDDDALFVIADLIAQSLARAFAKKMDNIGFLGDGTSTYFGVKGIIQRLLDVNGVDDGGGLVLGSGNLWSELTLADFEKVMGALPQYAADDAQWYCSRAFFFTVMVKLMLASGGVTAAEIEGRRRPMFLGLPVEITQVMPSAEANSQIPAVLGDLRKAATVGDRRRMSIDQSTHYKFAARQVAVLGTRRVAVNVHDVGTDTEAGPVVGLITQSS